MRKNLMRMLILLTVIALLPANAFAAKASISLGGKVGFMYEGSSVTLRPKLKNVSQSSLIWASSDEEVATVFSGKITAGAAGRTVIAVSGGGARARCGVVVFAAHCDAAGRLNPFLALWYGRAVYDEEYFDRDNQQEGRDSWEKGGNDLFAGAIWPSDPVCSGERDR